MAYSHHVISVISLTHQQLLVIIGSLLILLEYPIYPLTLSRLHVRLIIQSSPSDFPITRFCSEYNSIAVTTTVRFPLAPVLLHNVLETVTEFPGFHDAIIGSVLTGQFFSNYISHMSAHSFLSLLSRSGLKLAGRPTLRAMLTTIAIVFGWAV